MALRDASVIVIETARTVVRGGLGLHELLKTPSVIIQARVGLRKNASTFNEFQVNSGATENGASSSRASSLPLIVQSNASVNDYLVGTQLDDALAAGQDIAISWPFADGDVRDWAQAEAIWKYVLFNQLERRRAQNESPVLLSMYHGLSRDTYEKTCQVFFERFNVAGLGILERPMAQLYATTNLSGVVVDIEYDKTDITPIYEGFIQRSACDTIPLGIRDCHNYLIHILRSNQSLMKTLFPPNSEIPPTDAVVEDTLLALVKQILDDGHIKVPSDGETAIPEDEGITDIAAIVVAGKEKAVIESGMKKKANAKASAAEQARAREIEALDLITVQFRDKSVTLGKERHRLCEPLFDPTLLDGLNGSVTKQVPLQQAVGHAVREADVDMRRYIWDGLLVTGDITRNVKGIAIALQSRLSPFIAQPELVSDLQPRSIRILGLPEYYPEYRDTGEGFAAFLGSSIVAKLTFSDPHTKNFVSKADYTHRGPRSIIEMSPSLL